MIKNRAWGSVPKGGPSFNLFKDIHRKTVIEHSGGSSCDELVKLILCLFSLKVF